MYIINTSDNNSKLLVDATSKGYFLRIAKCSTTSNEAIAQLPQEEVDELPFNGHDDASWVDSEEVF